MNRKYVRIYNLKIDELIEKENLYAEIILTYDLPYYLEDMDGVYKSILEENFFSKMIEKRRKIFFAIERNWVDKQNVYVKESTIEIGPEGYTCQTSTVTICIQLYKEDLSILRRELVLSEDIIKEIMQKTLEFIVFKYNEIMDGKHFFTPTYLDCSMICYMICKNYLEKKDILWQKVTPNDLIVNDNKNIQNIDEKLLKNIVTWKYFFNKTKHHFYCFEYLDAIISGAICIESYIYNILAENLKNEKEIEDFSTEKNEKGEKYALSLRRIIKKIRDNGWIKYTLSNTKMDKLLSKILEPRNNIMHGKHSFNFNLKENATKSYNALIEFFEMVSTIKNTKYCQKEEYIYSINTNKFLKYKQDIQKALKERNIQKRNNLIKKAITYYPDNQLGYRIIAIDLAKQYLQTKSEETKLEFEKYINQSIEKSNNKNQSLLFKAYGFFIMKDYNKSFETLNEISREDIDERCICLYIQNSLAFCKGALNNENNRINIKRTYCLSRYHNPTYDLLYIVAGDMFFDFGEYEKAKIFYEKVYKKNTLNKFLLLRILRCYKELNDYNNLLELIDDILKNEFFIFDEYYQIDFEEFYTSRLDFYNEIEDIIHNKFWHIPFNSILISTIEKNNKVFLLPQSIEYLEKKYNRKIKTNEANKIFKNPNMNAEIRIGTSGLDTCMVEMKMGQLINIGNIKDEMYYKGNLHS